MKTLRYEITGTQPLLFNNPQCVDKFNKYSQLKKPLISRGSKRTEDEESELQELEIRSKIYWNKELGIYVPSTWVSASLNKVSFSTTKIAKGTMRGSVFMNEPQLKLTYKGMNLVKEPVDIVKNIDFKHSMILPQGQVRLLKVFPIFHNWSFTGTLDYDDSVVMFHDLKLMFEKAAHYNGFGDFRPSFGRASVVITEV